MYFCMCMYLVSYTGNAGPFTHLLADLSQSLVSERGFGSIFMSVNHFVSVCRERWTLLLGPIQIIPLYACTKQGRTWPPALPLATAPRPLPPCKSPTPRTQGLCMPTSLKSVLQTCGQVWERIQPFLDIHQTQDSICIDS